MENAKKLAPLNTFDKSCQTRTIPLHRETNKNRDIMMDFIISAGTVLAQVAGVVVLLAACAAIYAVETRSVEEEA